MARLRSYLCCGLSLRTGSFIVGYIQLIVEIIAGVTLTVALVQLRVELEQCTDRAGCGIDMMTFYMGIVAQLFLVVLLTYTIMLLVALHQHKRDHMKGFLIWHSVLGSVAALLLLFFVWTFWFLFDVTDVAVSVAVVLGTLIQAYFLLVVYSHLLELASNKGTIYRPVAKI